MKQFNHNIPSVVVYCNTALIAVFAAVNVIVYRKNTATRYLKVMSTIEIGIEYLLIGVQTDASFISYAILGIFILQIPYYEKKSLKRTAAGMLIFIHNCNCCCRLQREYMDRTLMQYVQYL